MKRLVILGAGTAGTIMSNLLRKRLRKSEWAITVVDRDNEHYYQPGFLFVPFGFYARKDIVKPRSKFLPRGVEFIVSEVDKIDPAAKRGRLPGRQPRPLRHPHRRHRRRDRAGRDAGHARRLARHDLRLLHPRRRRGPDREAQGIPGRPDRHPRQRDAHQVPGRPARVRLLLRRLPAPPPPPRQDRPHLRHAPPRGLHQAGRLEDPGRDARGEAHPARDRLQRRARRRRRAQARRIRRARGPLRSPRHRPDQHGRRR